MRLSILGAVGSRQCPYPGSATRESGNIFRGTRPVTINSKIRVAGPYLGDGTTATFPFNFKVFKPEDLHVVQLGTDGVELELTLNSGFTVALNADQNATPGGTITLPLNLSVGVSLLITSNIEPLQRTQITNQGGFFPTVVTDMVDRLTILVQQQQTGIDRSFKLPISDSAATATLPTAPQRAGKLLAFDENGNPWVKVPAVDSSLELATGLAQANGPGLLGFIQGGPGTVARSLLDKLLDLTITFEDFGARGDGAADDTAAIRLAIRFSQLTGRVVHGSHGKTYRISGTLQLVNQVDGRVAQLQGTGRNSCTIVASGTFDAVRAWGLGWGGSGQGAAFRVRFCGFEINASGLTGRIFDIRRTGLWSEFSDLRGHSATGIGMYLQSVFDHLYRDIEIRACTDLGLYIFETGSDGPHPDGFQECSFLRLDNVHVIGCNAGGTQALCSGGDAYTFTSFKPSEGRVGLQFGHNSVGHTIVGTYADGQTQVPFDNVGIQFGFGCFGSSVVGGRYWNVRYAVDFAGGGRATVSATNVVFDSPVGANVFDVRLQSGVQQIVEVAAGLNVLNQSSFALRQAVDSSTGTFVPTIYADAGQVGNFTYTTQYGEWRITNRVATVKLAIVWSARPTAGAAFGIGLPFAVPTGASHFSIRFAPAVMTVNAFNTVGHFQDNSVATKLYFYVGAGNTGANIDEIPPTGAVIAEMTFFLN